MQVKPGDGAAAGGAGSAGSVIRQIPPWLILVLFTVAYLPGPIPSGSPESWVPELTAEVLLSHHSLDLSELYPRPVPGDGGRVRWEDRELVSSRPIVSSILSLPVALIVRGIEPETDPVERSRHTGRAAAAFFTAAALALTHAILRRRTSPGLALVLTLGAGLASPLYSVASRSLRPDALAALCIAALAWLLFSTANRSRSFWVGTVLALLFNLSPGAAIAGVALVVATLWRARRGAVLTALGAALAAGLLLVVDVFVREPQAGDYFRLTARHSGFAFPQPLALAAYLVSPGRGLLFFAPLSVLSVAGLVAACRNRTDARLVFASASAFAATLLGASSMRPWTGGDSFGPALLTASVPLLAIMASFASPPAIRRLAVVLIPAAVLHALFVFAGGHTWDQRRQVDSNPAAVWDFVDSPFADLVVGAPTPRLDRLPRAALSMALGRHLSGLGGENEWFVYGWEPPEANGIWASGRESWIAFKALTPGDYTLSISAAAPSSNGQMQRLVLQIDRGEDRSVYLFDHDLWQYEDIQFDFRYDGGVTLLRIRPRHTWFPGHGDLRRCSFFVRWVRLDRQQPQR